MKLYELPDPENKCKDYINLELVRRVSFGPLTSFPEKKDNILGDKNDYVIRIEFDKNDEIYYVAKKDTIDRMYKRIIALMKGVGDFVLS